MATPSNGHIPFECATVAEVLGERDWNTCMVEQKIKTQPGRFSLAGEGLNVGRDAAEPVTDDHPGHSPWAFVGGTIHKVVVDVAGDPWVDLEKDVEAAFARD